MRSGLQTPGAVPLLAMLVAALSSMTPIVCEAWMRPGVILGVRGYQTVLGDDAVMSRRARNYSNVSSFDSVHPLLQPMQIRKDGLDQLSIAGLPVGASVVSSPEKERTWWQQVCRISPLESHSSANDSSSASFSSSALSSQHTHLPDQSESDPIRISGNRVSPAAKTIQSAVENSSSSLHSSIVDSSSPIERNGSFLAVMVSLIVAIMWF